jgi:hypothetical protein
MTGPTLALGRFGSAFDEAIKNRAALRYFFYEPE